MVKLQEVVDKESISSNDEEHGRTRSVLNSWDCDSGEVSNGDEEECSWSWSCSCSCSCGESDLVHMDSRVVRQLQPEETSFEVVVCLESFGVFEGEVWWNLVLDGVRSLVK